MAKKTRRRKLTKAERRAIALRNLAKARRARGGRGHRGHGRRRRRKNPYEPRKLWKRRFKKKRTGLKRYGHNRGARVKVLTTGERRRGRRRRRRNPLLAAANPLPNPRRGRRRRKGGHGRKSSKRSRAAKKGWARRRARGHVHGGRSRKRKSSRRKSHHRKGHRKSPKRVAAGKKAARTRARRKAARGHKGKRLYGAARRAHTQKRWNRRRSRRAVTRGLSRAEAEGYAYEKRRRRHRRHRRRNPVLVNPLPNPRRRRHHRRRNPLVNPLPNPMTDVRGFVMKAVGLGFGYLMQDAIDRFGATHALTTDSTGAVQDTPAAGQIYDSEAVQLPIWSSPTRLAYNAAGLAIPGLLGRFFWPEFWNFAFAAAVVRVIGNVATSAVAQFAPANQTTLQLYGGEYAAAARLQQAGANALTQAQAGFFAGLPFGKRGGGRPLAAAPKPRQLAAPQRKLGDCGCGPSGSSAILTDPLQSAQGMLNTPFGPASLESDALCCFNPLTAGTSTDTTGNDGNVFTQPVTTPTLNPSTTITPITPSPVNTVTPTPPTSPTPPSPPPGCDTTSIQQMMMAASIAQGSGDQTAYNTVASQLAACGVNIPAWVTPTRTTTSSPTVNQPR